MYKRKIPIDLKCGISIALGVINGKWKPCLIDMLRDGAMRPVEMHKLLPDATPRVLNQQIKELEELGIMSKKVYAEIPPHTEYSLTDVGHDVVEFLDYLHDWGCAHREHFTEVLKKRDMEM